MVRPATAPLGRQPPSAHQGWGRAGTTASPFFHCCRRQGTVPGRQHDVGIVDREGRCEVDRVIATQGAAFGETAGGFGERGVDGDLGQLLVDLGDRANRSNQLRGVESAVATRRRNHSTRPGIDELPRED